MLASESNQFQHCYQVRIQGQIDDEFLASYCPPETVLQQDGDTTLLANIHTDQAGIVGLIRHLHNLGCMLLELKYEDLRFKPASGQPL